MRGYSLDTTLDEGDCLHVDDETWEGRSIACSPNAQLYRVAITVRPPSGQ